MTSRRPGVMREPGVRARFSSISALQCSAPWTARPSSLRGSTTPWKVPARTTPPSSGSWSLGVRWAFSLAVWSQLILNVDFLKVPQLVVIPSGVMLRTRCLCHCPVWSSGGWYKAQWSFPCAVREACLVRWTLSCTRGGSRPRGVPTWGGLERTS